MSPTQPNPAAALSGSAEPQTKRIYISNLDFSTTEEELEQFLQEFRVVSVLIPSQTVRGFRNSTVRPLGIGYADFASAADALQAVENLNGKQLRERTLKIKTYVPYSPRARAERRKEKRKMPAPQAEENPDAAPQDAQQPQPPAPAEEPTSKDTVYCAYLPSKVTDVELREFFADYQPQDIYVYRTNGSRRKVYFHRRFTEALVTLGGEAELANAIETLGTRRLMGKKITLRPARLSKVEEVQHAAARKLELEQIQQQTRQIAEHAMAMEEHRQQEAEIPAAETPDDVAATA
ncbi:Regulator of rDNA transcription protein 5 [Lachancea thermotolerans]